MVESDAAADDDHRSRIDVFLNRLDADRLEDGDPVSGCDALDEGLRLGLAVWQARKNNERACSLPACPVATGPKRAPLAGSR